MDYINHKKSTEDARMKYRCLFPVSEKQAQDRQMPLCFLAPCTACVGLVVQMLASLTSNLHFHSLQSGCVMIVS